MEQTTPENCQTCFRPVAEAGSELKTQWISICRCDRPYNPKSQFSIDVCANCKLRVPTNYVHRVPCPGLCACENPDSKKVLAYIKQNESDPVSLDLASVGLTAESFPADRYAPLGMLGESSRATVILARDKQRGTKVAVKCFKKLGTHLQPTFDSEVRKNKQLTHTNIAKIVDHGFHNNKSPYLVTEYKEGFNLEQCLAIHGTPSDDVAVKVLLGICEVLLYAQTQSVLHRDIRPGNVIFLDDLNSEPSVSITDFALPKIKASEELTDARDAMYLSSDEARNMEFNEKSEIYSIGNIGYALLTGLPPFQEGTARDIKNNHALKLPVRITNVKFDSARPKDLEEIIERCMEKDPKERFDSVAKLSERLEVFPRRVQMRIAAVRAAKKRAKLLQISLIVLIVVILCVIGYVVFGTHK